ncbi:hypothetical protein THAOC_28243 [Thalassiosira oceanica]|uniref:MULE transposase domain-containing protein n=1 Tax=Thalassiosira oceanica TaxID=159749 RepID=K0S0Q0_THAOC|nr:hypothetical protein THAOC_28243 [Thalassiosira oceanica]|eukprot:EJK52472.1 hypothetical protein THAOC_28243 [Thalassiosira oceanica]
MDGHGRRQRHSFGGIPTSGYGGLTQEINQSLPHDDELSRHEVYYPPRNIHPPQNPGYCPPPDPAAVRRPPAVPRATARPVQTRPVEARTVDRAVGDLSCRAVKPRKKKKTKTKKEDTTDQCTDSIVGYPKNISVEGEDFVLDNINRNYATFRCKFWRQKSTSKCNCKFRYYPDRKVKVHWIERDHLYRECYSKNGKVPPDDSDSSDSESENCSDDEDSKTSEDGSEYSGFVLNNSLFQQLQVYFDGTFHCVPLPFKQLLIVMVFCDREQKYVPGIWILLTGKTKRCYYEAISWFARCKKDGEMPDINYTGVDFEPAFFQAIDIFLKNTFRVGCDFHYKQGPKKKCDEIGMPKPLTSLILTYLDYARVLPMEEMKDKGIYYLQHLIYDQAS